jgi:steroid delta-isomerase-like uncharacterized protein
MDDATTIARDYIEAWNKRDFGRTRSLLHPKYAYISPDGQREEGVDAGVKRGQMWATAFPDGKLEIARITASAEAATVECNASGTHKGELMGIAPTGRQVKMPYCTVIEIRDGKVSAEREYFDSLNMMRQLGIVTAPAGMRA